MFRNEFGRKYLFQFSMRVYYFYLPLTPGEDTSACELGETFSVLMVALRGPTLEVGVDGFPFSTSPDEHTRSACCGFSSAGVEC